MKQTYNSRERKIYSDYNSWQSEKLLELLSERHKYQPSVLSVVEDVLRERGVPFKEAATESRETVSDYGKDDFSFGKTANSAETDKVEFIRELREASKEEINGIISRYSSYKPGKVEAALTVDLERGNMSYEHKEMILAQINDNLKGHWNRNASFAWEKNNAFLYFTDRFSDEEIYSIIDDPKDIVIDVYHAVLTTAMQRELISGEDLNEYFSSVRQVLRTEEEIETDDVVDFFGLKEDNPLSDSEAQEEAQKYWVCPSCGEIVSSELSECWKCQSAMPESGGVHPGVEQMKREISFERKGFSIHPVVGVGLITLIVLAGSVVRSWIRTGDPYGNKWSLYLLAIVLGAMFISFIIKYNETMKGGKF